MAEAPRRSSREIKVKESKDYEYDEECLSEILQNSGKGSSIWQQRSTSVGETLPEEVKLSDTVQSSSWSEINYLPIYFNPLDYSQKCLQSVESDSDITLGNRSQDSDLNNSPNEIVNKNLPAGSVVVGRTLGSRLNSSTRYNFIDLEQNFLSAESSSVATGMSSTENEGEGLSGSVNSVLSEGGEHSGRKESEAESGVESAMLLVLEEMTKINKRMGAFGDIIGEL